MTPHEALTAGLSALADRNERTPCAGDPRFTSDDRHQLEAAATLCPPCPVLALCAAAGADEVACVWAGVDRTRRGRRRAAS